MYYIPFPQLVWGTPTIVVHTNIEATAAAPMVRHVLHELDPELPLYEVRTMDDYLALSVGRQKFQTVLLGSLCRNRIIADSRWPLRCDGLLGGAADA